MEEKKIMMDAAVHYGMHNQLLKLIEELGELQREAVRMLLDGGDADHFCEEWADVLIMLEQMVYFIPGAPINVVKFQNEKLKRLKERLEKEKGHEVLSSSDEKTTKIFKLLDLNVEMSEIARAVSVSPKTVANHRTILRKAKRGEPFSDTYKAYDAKLIRAVEEYIKSQ